MTAKHSTAIGVESSISHKHWQWRGGPANLTDGTESHDLVAQILLSRGVLPAELDLHRQPSLRTFLPDPSRFLDMDTAARRVVRAILTNETVTIYGDYDVDGATSAALLIRLLRMLGLSPGYYIPDRLLEGYGPTGESLVQLGRDGSTLVITVDCGAMAHDALAMAADNGIDVIVVDHHKCTAELPRALAMINPNRLDESDEAAAYGHLAAVGVAFLLAVAIVRELRNQGFFNEIIKEPDLLSLLDLVALGTVADVASLRGLNRAFVAQGLKVMAARHDIGFTALMDASRLSRAPTCSDLGFALGPRINAGGRIGESSLGVRLLTSTDSGEASQIAQRLSLLNDERRAIESAVQDAAMAQLGTQDNYAVNVLSGAGWHPGVIGIVAGRIKEKTGKPAIVIALDADEDNHAKGSGRSITGVDLGAAIISAHHSGLLIAGGGHAMAAGLTIEADKITSFTNWINEELAKQVSAAPKQDLLLLDLVVTPKGLNPALVQSLEAAGPYGMGWPGPRVAVGPVQIIKADIVGTDHVRLILGGADGGRVKAIAFRAAETELGQTLLYGAAKRRLWVAGRAKINDWNGQVQAELHLEDAAWYD